MQITIVYIIAELCISSKDNCILYTPSAMTDGNYMHKPR